MWVPCKTKKERKERIKTLLLSNDRAVVRGVLALYKRQTFSEQTKDATLEHNNQGFCAFDAPLMSLYAKQILEYGGLSKQQITIAREKILRYTKQLAELAELKEKSQHT